MPGRDWLRRAAWSGLTALGLTGCAAGVGRTTLNEPVPPLPATPATAQLPPWSTDFAVAAPNVRPDVSPPITAERSISGSPTPPRAPERPTSAAGLEEFQTLVVRSEAVPRQPRPASPSPSADQRVNVAPPVVAATTIDDRPTQRRAPDAAAIQLVDHEDPLPFPEFLAEPPAAAGDPFITPVADEVPAAPAASTDAAPLAPAAMEPAAPQRPSNNACQYPLNLGTALSLVAGQNPEVGFAQWRVQEAYARLEQADVLWLPHIQAGLNYHRHDGNLQNIEGFIRDINRSSLNAGLGAGALAAGTTTVPGVVAQFHVSDAVFQPRIAERTAWARQHAADAVLQDRMLEAALAYLELLEAAQGIAIAQEILADTAELSHITDQYARTGQGLLSDADRLQTELALRRNDAIRANERFAVASARLAEVLSLDANYQLLPCEVTVVPIDLVPLDHCRQELVASGLSHRPELKESRCLVAEACERLRREQFAPLMPSVLLGLSYGGFGGGVGGNVARFNDRADFDALAYWQVRNLGFGERAQRQLAGSQIEQAKFAQVRLMDRIAREIVESQTQVQHRLQQIEVAQAAVAAAQQSHERNLARIREGQGLPIEALQSINALNSARREYLTSVMDYNEAQFRLQRALGWPVGDAA